VRHGVYLTWEVGILSQEQVLACVVDCIDCVADSAVVAAVLEGVAAAQNLAVHLNASEMCSTIGRPWIMVSINDDEDPHFRKADELLRNMKSFKL
jgi:hypothetical protein